MKLIIEALKLFINKMILRKSNGACARIFCTNMGIVYIKLGQILAMQNINDIFTEEDRQQLLSICDNCNQIAFEDIHKIILNEYEKCPFISIEKEPLGSASVSQVHKAMLANGDAVAIKVKRKDIADTVEKDIKQIKFCVKHFGRFINITNLVGSYRAFDFYLQWINQEIDFLNEANNIELYTNFANKVNNKIEGYKIVLPKLYKEYCTDNIIVLEYIQYKTISELQVTEENAKIVNKAMEGYIKLSFYALFNNLDVVWHGDPHAGNIYIDDSNNVGFLDMGLVFSLTPEERDTTLDFFFCAYFGNWSRLYDMLAPYIKEDIDKKNKFKEACKKYCEDIKHKPITSYFMDLVWVCLEYNIKPPDFLYGMAKAFICLFGIDVVYYNTKTGKDIIEKQVIEYVLNKAIDKGNIILKSQINILDAIIRRDRVKLVDNIYTSQKELKGIVNIIKELGGTHYDKGG